MGSGSSEPLGATQLHTERIATPTTAKRNFESEETMTILLFDTVKSQSSFMAAGYDSAIV
jgi:hypothetical protein